MDLNSQLPVILAGLSSIVVGSLWYSPILFGNFFVKTMGWNAKQMKEAQQSAGPSYIMTTIASLIMAWVLNTLITRLGITDVISGLELAFLLWLGIAFPVILSNFLWGTSKWGLFYLNASFQLVQMLVMTAILIMI